MPLDDYRITSSFGSRWHPINGSYRHHNGVDVAAPHGSPVRAASSGTVAFRGWKGEAGNMVTIRHADGVETLYLHMSSFASGISVGSTVSKGQTIGHVGQTGSATGPHVCYRVRKRGSYVDPLVFHASR